MAYDIFISFKNSDANGRTTKDSEIAQKLFDFLTEKGLRVFFSNEVLERLGKAQYTRVIDEALDSTKVLIAVGCSHDNLNSQWVRYEWESFINDIRSGIKSDAEVFVLYNGLRASELPRALRQQQAFDESDAASYVKLYNFISNALGISIAPVSMPVTKALDAPVYVEANPTNLPTVPSPTEDFEYFGQEFGAITVNKYIGSNEVVVIPKEINGCPVFTVGYHCFYRQTAYPRDVYISDGITDIAPAAFQACLSLRKIRIPSSVKNIYDDSFQSCYNVVFEVSHGSYAEEYANKHGMQVTYASPSIPKATEIPLIKTPQPTVTRTAATTDLKNFQAGNIVQFGNYQWIVLDVLDDKALILSKDVPEDSAYHAENTDVMWATCSLRDYLNGEFYSRFSEQERNLISTTVVEAARNPSYSQVAIGNPTEDKVFLLSTKECKEYQGIWKTTSLPELATEIEWWLRSPGYGNDMATIVTKDGWIMDYGDDVSKNYGVRPAMWIKLDGADSTTQQTAESGLLDNENRFSQLLSQLQNNEDCLVYLVHSPAVAITSWRLYCFYSSGVVISGAGISGRQPDFIMVKNEIVRSAQNKGFGYPTGNFVIKNDKLEFLLKSENDGQVWEYKYRCKLKNDGNIEYDSNETIRSSGNMTYCGAFIDGFFESNDQFDELQK